MRAYFQDVGNASQSTNTVLSFLKFLKGIHTGNTRVPPQNPGGTINEKKKENIIKSPAMFALSLSITLEIVITRAAPAFHKLFMVMGCVFDINTAHKTVEKLTFQAFY